MTLGLATCDEDGIYLAIESQGLPTAGSLSTHQAALLINSKILELQSEPEIVALVAGGLEHWLYVATKYSKQSCVTAAAHEVVSLLNSCMCPHNQAFGIICGYSDGVAKCYRVNREQHVSKTELLEDVSLKEVQCLGFHEYAKLAKDDASNAINNKIPPLLALIDAIQRQFPKPNIRPPIHVLIIRPKQRIACGPNV